MKRVDWRALFAAQGADPGLVVAQEDRPGISIGVVRAGHHRLTLRAVAVQGGGASWQSTWAGWHDSATPEETVAQVIAWLLGDVDDSVTMLLTDRARLSPERGTDALVRGARLGAALHRAKRLLDAGWTPNPAGVGHVWRHPSIGGDAVRTADAIALQDAREALVRALREVTIFVAIGDVIRGLFRRDPPTVQVEVAAEVTRISFDVGILGPCVPEDFGWPGVTFEPGPDGEPVMMSTYTADDLDFWKRIPGAKPDEET